MIGLLLCTMLWVCNNALLLLQLSQPKKRYLLLFTALYYKNDRTDILSDSRSLNLCFFPLSYNHLFGKAKYRTRLVQFENQMAFLLLWFLQYIRVGNIREEKYDTSVRSFWDSPLWLRGITGNLKSWLTFWRNQFSGTFGRPEYWKAWKLTSVRMYAERKWV